MGGRKKDARLLGERERGLNCKGEEAETNSRADRDDGLGGVETINLFQLNQVGALCV